MVDARGVNVLEASQNLVEEELNVVVGEGLIRLNDLRQVGLHQLRNYINFIKAFSVLRFQDALYPKHVFVL